MILQPLFRIRSLYVSHVLYTAYLESKGICYPIVWLLVKWALRGVYELTEASVCIDTGSSMQVNQRTTMDAERLK